MGNQSKQAPGRGRSCCGVVCKRAIAAGVLPSTGIALSRLRLLAALFTETERVFDLAALGSAHHFHSGRRGVLARIRLRQRHRSSPSRRHEPRVAGRRRALTELAQLLRLLSPGAGRTHRAYLWAYRSGPHATAPAVVFDFQMSRAGKHAQEFLQGYQGALMVDDYAGYKALFAAGSVTELACLAQVRRKFFELHAANKSLVAAQALTTIGQLYQIERQSADWSALERQALRMNEAKPILDAWRVWLMHTRRCVPDSSGTARAIDYALRR